MFRYCLTFLVALPACFALIAVGNYVYLDRTGEIQPIEESVTRHQSGDTNCIFGTGMGGHHFKLKLTTHERLNPTIVAWGSSRAMQFAEIGFTQNFYNMGGSIRSIKQGWILIEALRHYQSLPQTILLSVDPWWFHSLARRIDYDDVPPDENWDDYKKVPQPNKDTIWYPTRWLLDGSVPLSHYLSTIFFGARDPSGCSIGARALVLKEGYDPKGVRHYTPRVQGRDRYFKDRKFQDILSRVEDGNRGGYHHATEADGQHIEAFAALIQHIRKLGITIIPFMAPFAPPVYDAMEQGEGYRYVDDAFARLRTEHDIEVIDLRDPEALGASACEFLDGDHPGVITTMRVLRALHVQVPVLKRAIDPAILTEHIERYAGLSAIPNGAIYERPEVDFLGIGCSKSQ